MNCKLTIIPALLFSVTLNIFGQAELSGRLRQYFVNYEPKEQKILPKPKYIRHTVSKKNKTLNIYVGQNFAAQTFTPETTEEIYSSIRELLPATYRNYKLKVITNGYTIDELVPNRLASTPDKERQWGNISYTGKPWVTNTSLPYSVSKGLANRHLSVWASHGRFYDWNRDIWRWQRPKLFGTTEDLFTPTIVVPYLIPMLENAGAIVFTPRERDWQKHEVIVDNDNCSNGHYRESGSNWQTSSANGFAWHPGTYLDGENPFQAGTARMVQANSSSDCSAIYQPTFNHSGRYAVYVSYQTLPGSIDDAHYIVFHRGQQTHFRVNQQMGGGTWVYLGTFDFADGNSSDNCVVLTTESSSNGIVTTDAIRFGGGMGNIEREGSTSRLPRALEAARYYAQWAGMPYDIYASRNGTDDYSDDINTRSFMTNRLAGGSCYMPDTRGGKVPLELSVAIHSDAGYVKDSVGLIGSLSICTTKHNDGKLNAGISRLASRDLAHSLLDDVTNDMKRIYGEWRKRQIYDRNYSETRVPGIPSAILETMSHQNFYDMRYGQDPNFKHHFARAIYKSILKHVCHQHGTPYCVIPLPPSHFRVTLDKKGTATLSWAETSDTLEPTAKARNYILYVSRGDNGFDNGTLIKGTSASLKLQPNLLYRFKVAASNDGGKSLDSEELCALYNPDASKTILVVNGFNRLASPAVIDNDSVQGFDFNKDPGISLGHSAGWVGKQMCFNRETMGREDEDGLGWSNDDYTGMFIAGNCRNYVRTHCDAILTAGKYSIASCSSSSVEKNLVMLGEYQMIDLILGLECDDGWSLHPYKTFSPAMQQKLRTYLQNNGSLLVSGTNIASDMTAAADSAFVADCLRYQFAGNNQCNSNQAEGMGTKMTFVRTLNENHYAAISPDNLHPIASGFAALRYADGYDACVANNVGCKTFAMGFPFECIEGKEKQAAIMRGILQFLLE